MTSWPSDLALTRSMKSRATLKFTSASKSAKRTSRSESPTFASEIFPRPRRLRNAFCNLLLNESNMFGKLKFGVQSSRVKVLKIRANDRRTSALACQYSDGLDGHGHPRLE